MPPFRGHFFNQNSLFMFFSQLQSPIPILTPKGKALAIGIIDYGPDWDLQWVTFIQETGECWTFVNSEIRQSENYTLGNTKHEPPKHKTNGNGKDAANFRSPVTKNMDKEDLNNLH